jgi:hypothetical protein
VKNLNRGWVPEESIRICWACWLFRPYGETSQDFWKAKIPALAAPLTETEIFNFVEGERVLLPAAAHCAELWMWAQPESTAVSCPCLRLGVQRCGSAWDRHWFVTEHLCRSGDVQELQENWEIRFWLGQKGIPGLKETSLMKDARLRCPDCVLKNNVIRLTHRGMKIAWSKGDPHPDVILENTLRKRAGFLGYKWDPRRQLYTVTEVKRGLTGSYRERQKKERAQTAASRRQLRFA